MSKEIRIRQAYLRQENRKYSSIMGMVAKCDWPAMKQQGLKAVFRSSEFFAQVFGEQDGAVRMSVNRTQINDEGQWLAGISWDDLMRIKAECGFAELWAVEILPAQSEIVNVANMRHIFLLPEAPSYAWRSRDRFYVSKTVHNCEDVKFPACQETSGERDCK